MNLIKKIGITISTGLGLITASLVGATSTVDTIGTDLAPVLTATVQAIISTFISFVTDNLPLIIVFGFVVGMIFWLIAKARRGARGG